MVLDVFGPLGICGIGDAVLGDIDGLVTCSA